MLAIRASQGVESYMISFRRGEMVIEELRKFLKENNIDAGVFTCGIGSFDICNLHAITNTDLPPVDKYYNLTGPVEVGSLGGSVAGGEPHIHAVVSDPPNDKVYVGHLEPGSRCCYRVEIGLLAFTGIKTTRVTDEKTGLIDIMEA